MVLSLVKQDSEQRRLHLMLGLGEDMIFMHVRLRTDIEICMYIDTIYDRVIAST